MKNIKNFFLFLFVICMITAACEGPEGAVGPQGAPGPQGEQGIQGAQGPVGIDGNANVTQYIFPVHNFSISANAALQITTTADTMNTSAWFVYLVRSSGNVYPIPGFGLGGTSDYRVYWSHSSGKVNFSINKVSGAGEAYESIRILRIYANEVAAGGRMSDQLPDIDFNNYYGVCRYYNVPY